MKGTVFIMARHAAKRRKPKNSVTAKTGKKSKAETHEPLLDVLAGEMLKGDMSPDFIQSLVSVGIACEVRVKDKIKYFANPYIFKDLQEKSGSSTLLSIFSGLIYCNGSTREKNALCSVLFFPRLWRLCS